jgi:PIN domain nuclease of toxin-antitoxin system
MRDECLAVNALLDTHVLLWLVDDPVRLPGRVAELCEDERNELAVSIASFWEIAIKMSLGKIELADNALARLKNWCDENAVRIMPVEVAHCR